MAGQNHTLKQGHVNKLPLFIALGLAALSLIVVFILSHHKQQERSPIPTVPYDLEAQVQKAHDRSYDLQIESQKNFYKAKASSNQVAKEQLSAEEERARAEVLAFERAESSYEDDYRRYQELLPKERLRQGKTNEELSEIPERPKVQAPTKAQYNTRRYEDYQRALTSGSKVEIHKNDNLETKAQNTSTTASGRELSANTLEAYASLKTKASPYRHQVEKPESPYCLLQGSILQAVLLSGINSELPGQITAQITEDILDTPTGRYVLIPKGSRLIGQYGSNARYAQKRVFLGFNRLLFPDGRSLKLNAMPGQSTDGYAGLEADVDNHYLELISGCILMSTISTASYIQDYNDDDDDYSVKNAMSLSLADNLSSTLSQVIERNLNISPTLKVKPGFLLSIAVTDDLYFPSPYKRQHI